MNGFQQLAPRSERVRPAAPVPLIPSDWWTSPQMKVEWETVRYSKLAQAAKAVKLEWRQTPDGLILFSTTAMELLLLLAYWFRIEGKVDAA